MPQIHLRAQPDDYGRSRGILAFEMETSVLYYLAARANAAGGEVAAAAILTVSDVLSEGATPEESYLPLDQLNRSIAPTIEIALEAGIAV